MKVELCTFKDPLLIVIAAILLRLHEQAEVVRGSFGEPPKIVHAVFGAIQNGSTLAQQIVRQSVVRLVEENMSRSLFVLVICPSQDCRSGLQTRIWRRSNISSTSDPALNSLRPFIKSTDLFWLTTL